MKYTNSPLFRKELQDISDVLELINYRPRTICSYLQCIFECCSWLQDVLVSGGGLTKDKTRFKRCLSNGFFLPLNAVTKVYRGKFMDGLKKLHDSEKLHYYHDAQKFRNSYEWKELLNTCYRTAWNVEIKPLAPIKKDGNAAGDKETTDNAVSYFARYTNRTAISNSRILSYDREKVTFRYKDYQGSSYTMKEMTISTDEFIRRFLMHLLPPGFCRVRSAGFLACCIRKKSLELIYELQGLFAMPQNPDLTCFFITIPTLKVHFSIWEKDSRSGSKNFLYKGVHRVRTGSDSVQKKYLSVCLVKNGALSKL